jgi:hypothetical protein
MVHEMVNDCLTSSARVDSSMSSSSAM